MPGVLVICLAGDFGRLVSDVGFASNIGLRRELGPVRKAYSDGPARTEASG